jgi:hypothetical protein
MDLPRKDTIISLSFVASFRGYPCPDLYIHPDYFITLLDGNGLCEEQDCTLFHLPGVPSRIPNTQSPVSDFTLFVSSLRRHNLAPGSRFSLFVQRCARATCTTTTIIGHARPRITTRGPNGFVFLLSSQDTQRFTFFGSTR